jgi:hypothetical protein
MTPHEIELFLQLLLLPILMLANQEHTLRIKGSGAPNHGSCKQQRGQYMITKAFSCFT